MRPEAEAPGIEILAGRTFDEKEAPKLTTSPVAPPPDCRTPEPGADLEGTGTMIEGRDGAPQARMPGRALLAEAKPRLVTGAWRSRGPVVYTCSLCGRTFVHPHRAHPVEEVEALLTLFQEHVRQTHCG